MDFDLTPEQLQLQELAGSFARKELGPMAREVEDENKPLPPAG